MKATLNDLHELVPLRHLTPDLLSQAQRHSRIETLAPNESLLELTEFEDQRILFVRTGSAELRLNDGQSLRVVGGTVEAHFALPMERAVSASSGPTGCELVLLPATTLAHMQQIAVPAEQGIEVKEGGMEEELVFNFHRAVQSGEFELPSMPDLALRISRAMNDPNTTNSALARIIQTDPALTARVIGVVNSAAYGAAMEIKNLPDAIARLGRQTIRNLVISFILKGLFRSSSKLLNRKMQQLWYHSSRVAAIAFVLARITPGFDPDHALLAGLVHDIGKVPLLDQAREYPELQENPVLLEAVLHKLRGEIGMMTLRKWEFPEEFLEIVEHAENWQYESDRPSYADLVIMAQLHSFVGSPQMARLPNIDSVPAFAKLALGKLSPRLSIAVLDKAEQDIQSVENLLRT